MLLELVECPVRRFHERAIQTNQGHSRATCLILVFVFNVKPLVADHRQVPNASKSYDFLVDL